MEKRFSTIKQKYKRIVITGPESTGKTWLAKSLALHYKTSWIPEYAREYVEKLKRNYNYSDLVVIAQNQINTFNNFTGSVNKFLFLDTDLIILKVWFNIVYNECPDWLLESITDRNIDLYLLCNTDIEWKFDKVRENPGVNREVLLEKYKQEIEISGTPFVLINGMGNARLNNAITALERKEWNI